MTVALESHCRVKYFCISVQIGFIQRDDAACRVATDFGHILMSVLSAANLN